MAFNIDNNRELLNYCIAQYKLNSDIYNHMYNYYCGCTLPSGRTFIVNGGSDKTDISNNYNSLSDRTRHKVGVNYIKKFIKEEVSYSVGNEINYMSNSEDPNIINEISKNFAHWDETQDTNLMKNMLLYSKAYELYYVDSDTGKFCGTVISPRHGYAYCDNTGKPIYFLHFFSDDFDKTNKYIDIYTANEIIHCDETLNELPDKARQINTFGVVPIGIAKLSDEDWLDTIYNDIKGLQDAFEINLTNLSQEITELRNAYLWLNNIELPKDSNGNVDTKTVKKSGVLETKGDNKNVNAQWLVKNINDSFVQNVLNKIEDLMYKITFHINTNEKMQSNTSSLALKARLIGLEEKCKLNQKALANCIKTRLQMLFLYLNFKQNTTYDYSDILIKFTPNVPQDDLMMAQIVNYMGNKLTLKTALSLFSFVENPEQEAKDVKKEQEEDPVNIGKNILNNAMNSKEGNSNEQPETQENRTD